MPVMLSSASIDALRAQFSGTLYAPGDAGYDETRAVHNGMIDKRPALIARCANTADIADASTTLGRKGSVTRRQMPTSPVGENTMKPTNNNPKYNSQFGVQIDRYSWNRM